MSNEFLSFVAIFFVFLLLATSSITPGVKLRNRGWFRSSVTSSISGSPVSTGEQSEQLEETYDVCN